MTRSPFDYPAEGSPGPRPGWALPGPVETLFPEPRVRLMSSPNKGTRGYVYTKQCVECGALIPHNAQTMHYFWHEEQRR